MPPKQRIVIYTRGTKEQIEQQRTECYEVADQLGDYDVVSVAADPPDSRAAWESARTMVESGEADRILVSAWEVIPLVASIDSLAEGPALRRRPRKAQPPWQRRPRRLLGLLFSQASWGSAATASLLALLSTFV